MGNANTREQVTPALPPGRVTTLTADEVIEALEAEIRRFKPTPPRRPLRQLPVPGAAALSEDDGKALPMSNRGGSRAKLASGLDQIGWLIPADCRGRVWADWPVKLS